jgi:hypothetical protein
VDGELVGAGSSHLHKLDGVDLNIPKTKVVHPAKPSYGGNMAIKNELRPPYACTISPWMKFEPFMFTST